MSKEEIIECTYIMKMLFNGDDPEVTREIMQQVLGPEHEVVSANSVLFDSTNADRGPSVIHHVIKVNTPAPTAIANRLMGDSWVRKIHQIFTIDNGSDTHKFDSAGRENASTKVGDKELKDITTNDF